MLYTPLNWWLILQYLHQNVSGLSNDEISSVTHSPSIYRYYVCARDGWRLMLKYLLSAYSIHFRRESTERSSFVQIFNIFFASFFFGGNEILHLSVQKVPTNKTVMEETSSLLTSSIHIVTFVYLWVYKSARTHTAYTVVDLAIPWFAWEANFVVIFFHSFRCALRSSNICNVKNEDG